MTPEARKQITEEEARALFGSLKESLLAGNDHEVSRRVEEALDGDPTRWWTYSDRWTLGGTKFILLGEELSDEDTDQLDCLHDKGFAIYHAGRKGSEERWLSITIPGEEVQPFSEIHRATP
ncbi:hypothetical protein [Corynebacterium marinum]|uniref:hypothetical protein n=1 Tax=Corynebacterium marinum TaxID=349751 RepID=UPI0012EBCE8A|nr:hypothetical protein [Corynebacterium marinum]